MSRAVQSDIEWFAEIEKVDEERRTVFGWASTETRDRQGEIVTKAAIEAALPGYMLWKNVREMHQPSAVGTAVEASMMKKGLWFGAKVSDDRAWKKVTDKVYKGFSIGGRVVARDPDDPTIVTKVDITEISLVDRPANPDARFELIKRAGDHLLMQPVQYWGCGCADHQHLAKSEAQECMADAADELRKREFDAEARREAAGDGDAMGDGSFPILTKHDLRNAVLAHGRAKDPDAVKQHIVKRAKKLGAESMLPAEWVKGVDLEKATPRHIEGGRFAGHLKSCDEAGAMAKNHSAYAASFGKLADKHRLLAEESRKAGNDKGAAAHESLAKAHSTIATNHERQADRYTRLAARHGEWAAKGTTDHPSDAVSVAKAALAAKLAQSLRLAA